MEEATFGGSRSMRENYQVGAACMMHAARRCVHTFGAHGALQLRAITSHFLRPRLTINERAGLHAQDLGVDNYYQEHGATYRNPHFPGIVAAAASILDLWWSKHVVPAQPSLPVMDPLTVQLVSGEPGQGGRQLGHDSASTADQCTTQGTANADCPAPSACHAQNTQPTDCEDPAAGAGDKHPQDPSAANPAIMTGSCSDQVQEQEQEGHRPQPHHTPHAPRPVGEACDGYSRGPQVRILDLACGAGEATQAVEGWWVSRGGAGHSPSTNAPGQLQGQPQAGVSAAAAGDEEAGLCEGPGAETAEEGDREGSEPAAASCTQPHEQAEAAPALQAEAGGQAQDVFVPPPSAMGLHLPTLLLGIDAADPFTGWCGCCFCS